VLSGVAAGLDAIHRRGIVHRDVKPANVLLGSEGAVKLADLGIAGVADRTRITRSDEVVGSLHYMAPEQLEGGNAGPAIDVYGLAAVAYETLSGERAHPESNPLALANAITNQPPPDLADVWPDAPAGAAEVLTAGMAVDPRRRPGSAGELVERLRTSLRPAAPPPRRLPLARQPAAPPPGRRRGAVVPALLAVAALAIAGVVYAAASATNGGSPAGSRSAGTNKKSATTDRRRATRPAAAGQTTRAAGSQTTAGAGAGSSTGTPSSSTASAPPATVGTAPARAVESFYGDAANHRYAAAWALADPNMRNQLGGYPAFQNQMSSVRSITFHRAQVAPGASAGAATVTVATTSVQATRTQQCAGTVRTIRSGSAWLLDAIAINC
jgi:serine/threonine-protein kinase